MQDTREELKKRLRAIYSETTVDHILAPRNRHAIPHADGFAHYTGEDGESMKIWLRIRNHIVEHAGFQTDGCAATIACGSMATELIRSKTIDEALSITGHDIAAALVDLPPGNLHCAELAAGAVRKAVLDYLELRRQPWKRWYRT